MKVSDLTPAALEKIKARSYDSFFEKHEGPWDWEGMFRYGEPEFLRIGEFDVLLPIDKSTDANLTTLRLIVAHDHSALTIFLKDTSYISDPKLEIFETGRLAVCTRVPGEEFFLAVVYHEWFIVEL